MQAVILAAGKGNRIEEIADGRPKCLLPFMGTTLLGHSLDLFAKRGVEEIVVVVGYERRTVMDYVDGNWDGRVTYVFNPLYETTNVIFSFWLSMPYLRNDVLYLHADTVFDDEKVIELGGKSVLLRYHGPNDGRGSISMLFRPAKVLAI